MEIKIKGEIGWDVFANDIERQLRYADGDITILLDTPGGGVYEGISIFNAIKNYSKGEVTIRVTGLCASMGSYIVLASPKRIFEPNSVVMVHNPAGAIWGDYRDVQSYGVLLEKLANLFRSKYSDELKLDYETIKEMMDYTTYFIGREELQMWGSVAEDKENEHEVDTDILKASAKERIKALSAKMTNDFVKADLDKVAKMLAPVTTVKSCVSNITQQPYNRLEDTKQEEKMDLNELKNKYPDIYTQAKTEGYQDGVKAGEKAERQRTLDHLLFFDIAKDEAEAAIKNGTSYAEMRATYDHKRVEADKLSALTTNSPANVNTDDPTKPNDGEPEDTALISEIEASLKARNLA